MRRRDGLLALAFAALPGWAQRAAPPEIAAELPGARLHGSGRLSFFGLHVYDARLWVLEAFDAERFEHMPLALELEYARTLRGRLIAERSLDEMRRLGEIDAAQGERRGHARLSQTLRRPPMPLNARIEDWTGQDEMARHQQVNYVGALHMLDAVLPQLLRQQAGHLSLVASVAGYRGLPNALAYGPTKAALINLAQTLYLDLQPQGLGVSVVNPGFVATPLTSQNRFAMPALISPAQAAQEIVRGWETGRFEIHFPKRFTLWLKALSHVGDTLYFKAIRRATGL